MNHKPPRRETLVLILGIILSSFSPAAANERSPTEPPALILKGKVEHSVTIPSLPENSRTGSIFDQSATAKGSKAPAEDRWFKIPTWLAGKWINDRRYLLVSGKEVKEENKSIINRYGHQRDWRGDVWQCSSVQPVNVLERRTYDTVQKCLWYSPVKVTEKVYVVRYRWIATKVDRKTKRIISVEQLESLQSFERIDDRMIRETFSVAAYDENGRKKPGKTKGYMYLHRKASFAPLNYFEGRDLKSEFTTFQIDNPANDSQDDELIFRSRNNRIQI